MIDTDDPQHWPGDSGAVIEACVPTDELLAQIANEAAWVALFQHETCAGVTFTDHQHDGEKDR